MLLLSALLSFIPLGLLLQPCEHEKDVTVDWIRPSEAFSIEACDTFVSSDILAIVNFLFNSMDTGRSFSRQDTVRFFIDREW